MPLPVPVFYGFYDKMAGMKNNARDFDFFRWSVGVYVCASLLGGVALGIGLSHLGGSWPSVNMFGAHIALASIAFTAGDFVMRGLQKEAGQEPKCGVMSYLGWGLLLFCGALIIFVL